MDVLLLALEDVVEVVLLEVEPVIGPELDELLLDVDTVDVDIVDVETVREVSESELAEVEDNKEEDELSDGPSATTRL